MWLYQMQIFFAENPIVSSFMLVACWFAAIDCQIFVSWFVARTAVEVPCIGQCNGAMLGLF